MKHDIEKISNAVATHLGFDLETLKLKTRKREICEARQWCMYFCIKDKAGSLKDIGLFFGGRDHSTVINAKDTIQDLIDTNRLEKQRYWELRQTINCILSEFEGMDNYSVSMLSLAR